MTFFVRYLDRRTICQYNVGMYQLKIRAHFDSAHYLRGYDGACSNLHGHRWLVEVGYNFPSIADGESNVDGIAVDFKVLKAELNSILPDHTCLNDILEENPTAENIAKWISGQLARDHAYVEVWETPECSVRYYSDQK